LCYFSSVNREYGVDYTNTELDLSFGRIRNDKNKPSIEPIDDNYQSEDFHYVYEKEARKIYRKWDNVKHISDKISTRVKARKKYNSNFWGLSVISKGRNGSKKDKGIKFSVIVTLKEIHGKNKIEEFIKLCQVNN